MAKREKIGIENEKVCCRVYVLTIQDCMHDCLEMNLFGEVEQAPWKGVQVAELTL